jgi:DNA polymerase-3 subunit beta
VLGGLHLRLTGDVLTITGSDLDLTIRLSVTVGGESDGTTVIPAKLAADIVRSLNSGAITLEAGPEEVTISGGRSEFTLKPYSAEDYPRVNVLDDAGVTLPVDAFADSLRQVVRAASTDELRQILTGVLLTAEEQGLRLVATDSYRLAVRDLPGNHVLGLEQRVIVPSRALAELQRMLTGAGDVALRLGDNEVTFDLGTMSLTTRLIAGEFPNYRQLIPPSHPIKVTLGRETLLEALRRVKIFARHATPVRLDLSSDGVTLSTIDREFGNATEVVDAQLEGDELMVAFNPEYLAQGVEAVGTDEVTIELLDGQKPAIIRGVGSPDYLYLLMPVKVPHT